MLRHQLEQTVQGLFSVSTLADRTGAFLGNTLGQNLPSLVHRPTFIMRLVFSQQEIQQFPVNRCLIDRVKNWALGLGNSLLFSNRELFCELGILPSCRMKLSKGWLFFID